MSDLYIPPAEEWELHSGLQVPPGSRRCARCRHPKPLDQFYLKGDPRYPKKRSYVCIPCTLDKLEAKRREAGIVGPGKHPPTEEERVARRAETQRRAREKTKRRRAEDPEWAELERQRQRESRAKRRARDPEKFDQQRREQYKRYYKIGLEKARARRQANPEIAMFRTAKARAAKQGMEFTIMPDDIAVPERCPILDIPLVVSTSGCVDGSASLDRVDNSKGYIPGNVAVISRLANSIKRNWGLREFESLVRYMRAHLPPSSDESM